ALVPELALLGKGQTITTAPFWNAGVDWISVNWYEPVQAFRNFMLMDVLIPVRKFFQAIPWVTLVALTALYGYRWGGWRVALIAALPIWFLAATGLWTQAMTTLYMIGSAAVVCIVVGFVLGVLASRTANWSRFASGVCDF